MRVKPYLHKWGLPAARGSQPRDADLQAALCSTARGRQAGRQAGTRCVQGLPWASVFSKQREHLENLLKHGCLDPTA